MRGIRMDNISKILDDASNSEFDLNANYRKVVRYIFNQIQLGVDVAEISDRIHIPVDKILEIYDKNSIMVKMSKAKDLRETKSYLQKSTNLIDMIKTSILIGNSKDALDMLDQQRDLLNVSSRKLSRDILELTD